MIREPGTPSANTKLGGGALERTAFEFRHDGPERLDRSPLERALEQNFGGIGRFSRRTSLFTAGAVSWACEDWAHRFRRSGRAALIAVSGRSFSETIMRRVIKRVSDTEASPPKERLDRLDRIRVEHRFSRPFWF